MKIWPGRTHKGNLGRRATELRLVSAQHRDTLTRHEDAALCCASWGALAARLQPCQADRDGPCAQPL